MTEKRNQDKTHEMSSPLPDKLPKVMAALTLHAGPLPPPETVERYELVLPGAFDRILTMAEKEQQNGFEHNRSGWFFAHCGQFFAFFLIVIYFSLLGLTIWFDSLTMFATVIDAGALAGLPALVRSFQNKGKNKQDS
jgi:uncharacterized membrane protein